MSGEMFIRIYLTVVAATFLAFGLWSLATPLEMTERLGVEVGGPNGAFEMRGIYGGVSLGAAVLCGVGAMRSAMQRPALWFLVTYMGGYCAARLIAWALGGPPTATFITFIAFEAAALIFALASLRGRSS